MEHTPTGPRSKHVEVEMTAQRHDRLRATLAWPTGDVLDAADAQVGDQRPVEGGKICRRALHEHGHRSIVVPAPRIKIRAHHT
jgi:hypothetical protein